MNPERCILFNPNFIPPRELTPEHVPTDGRAIHVNPHFVPQLHFNSNFAHLPTYVSIPNMANHYASATIPKTSSLPPKVESSRRKPAVNSQYAWRRNKVKEPFANPDVPTHSAARNNALLVTQYRLQNNLLQNYDLSMRYKSNNVTFSTKTSKETNKHKFIAKGFQNSHENTTDPQQPTTSTAVISHNGRSLVRKPATAVKPTPFEHRKKISPLKRVKPKILPPRDKLKIDKRPLLIQKRSPQRWKNVLKSRFKIENLFPKSLFNVNKYALKNLLSSPKDVGPIDVALSTPPKAPPVPKRMFGNRKVVNIGGILYRVSSHKLTRTCAVESPTNLPPRTETGNNAPGKPPGHIIHVRGECFILSKNGARLRRLPGQSSVARSQARVDFGGVTYKQTSDDILIRTESHRARSRLLQAKTRSIATLTARCRKINTPCLVYNKLGKCHRVERGNCPYVHDRRNVALCTRFLQGTCTEKNCLLSHDVVHQKVPTCHYYLESVCTRENCPYLHVKVSGKASICRAFLQGFCELGDQCSKRHVHICPMFEKNGKCGKGIKCPYPHKTRATIAENKVKKLRRLQGVGNLKNQNRKNEDEEPPATTNVRYYASVDAAESASGNSNVVQVPDRRKLEHLPAFIGFDEK